MSSPTNRFSIFLVFVASALLLVASTTKNCNVVVDAFISNKIFARPNKHQRSRYPRLFLSHTDFTDAKQMEQRVVVVGGGVGGLASAARIAASSPTACSVTIIEKNTEGGGRCGSFDVDVDDVGTFRHERGPSLLLLPDVYRDVFHDCGGRSAEDYGLSMAQCIPAYQVVFEDGDSIEIGFPENAQFSNSNSDDTRSSEIATARSKSREKMDKFEVDGALKWDEYMKAMSAYLDCGLPNFIEERLDILSLPAFLWEALRDNAKVSGEYFASEIFHTYANRLGWPHLISLHLSHF